MPKGCCGVICGIGKLTAGNSGGNIMLVPYIVDFICVEKNLVIEVDGGPHAENEEQDIQCSAYLNRMGYRVFRFWNNQVMQETEAVLEAILAILANTDQNSPSPQPSPPRGGEGEVIIAANHVPGKSTGLADHK
jgi:hypothetical protein